MILQAFSVFDTKGKAFNLPFFQPVAGLAVRQLTEMTADSKSLLAKYPEDFILYHVGSFDDATAVFTSMSPVVLVTHVKDLVVPKDGLN